MPRLPRAQLLVAVPDIERPLRYLSWWGSGRRLAMSLAAGFGGPARLGGQGGWVAAALSGSRWDGDARQPVVQGRSFSGLSITQMCSIRSPAKSKATAATVMPFR